ncbi:L-lactate dehydrogenase [Candidatus Saccharibacteria bacterium]|nr:L-lactate dehydrogenase [Candidatus Saccharibacteria bacterium]MCL1962654.1 L-lactate dehydrogenase [Candidatus Saccharibacteria bacterium]
MARTAIKISIIGAGFVGSTIAYTMMAGGTASDIVLVDANNDRAEGEAMDIGHGAALAKSTSVVRAGGYPDTANSDLVIITAGTNQKPGETRIDLIKRNAAIMRDVAQKVAEFSPNTIIMVISNPVDVMAYIAREVTGFPKHRVIGSGTVLDSSRFRYAIAKTFDIAPRDVNGYILGEHGDSEFPAWSLTRIAGMNLEEASCMFGLCFTDDSYTAIANEVKNAAYEIINRKSATYYGIGMAAMKIAEAIVRNEDRILPVSVMLNGEYGIHDVYLSLPVILNERGVKKILTPKLTDDEIAALQNSAEVLKQARESLD